MTADSQRSLSMSLYLAVAFGTAWSLWFVGWLITRHALSLPLFPVLVAGSFGPFIGALIATFSAGGSKYSLHFYARIFSLRMGWGVFLISFFLLPALAVIVEIVHAALTRRSLHFTMTLSEVPLNYLFLFILGGTLAEEYGWSLLSDTLDDVLPLKASTFVLGVIWALWHLPLFFIVTPGAIQGYTPFYIFLIATVSMRFLFAWAYHRGGRSVLSNMLFHTAANMAYSIVALAPAPEDMSTGRLWMFSALTIAAAFVLWNFAPPVLKSPERRAVARSRR
jgi:hypothetical protein